MTSPQFGSLDTQEKLIVRARLQDRINEMNRKGEVVSRFGSGVEPNADELVLAVKKALDEK